MDLPRDLIELFSAFARGKVRYLLVGGHAVAAHGRPRSTKDVDLWLAPEDANIQRACRALASFGAPTEIVAALRTSKPEDIVWMGRAPTRIDFLRTLPAVVFDDAWANRITVSIEGITVPVIGKADLVRNKTFVGRPQDRRDVRALTAVNAPKRAKKRLTRGK
jgi:hypothetical protein